MAATATSAASGGVVSMNAMAMASSAAVMMDRDFFADVAGSPQVAELAPADPPVCRRSIARDGGRQRLIGGLVRRIQEERDAVAIRPGTGEHAVRRGPVLVVRPHLHDVADVHDQRVMS